MGEQNLKLHSNLRKTIMVSGGIAISVFFMAIAIWNMDWRHVYEALSNAELYPWFFLSVLSYLTGLFARGVRTRLLVSRDANLSVLTASNIVVVGCAVNNILPARIGELARAGMLCERTGISFAQSAAVVFLERVMDGIVILLLLIVSALLMNAGGSVEETIYFSSVIFGLSAVCVMLVVIAPNRLMGVISKIFYAISPRWHDAAMRFMTSFVNGFNYFRRPADALKVFVLSIVIWLFDAGLFLFLLPAFGLEMNIWLAVFLMTLTNLGFLFPFGAGYSSPGYIGPYHSPCIQGLVLLGVAQATAVGFAMVMHLAFYIPIVLWGGAVILWYGITLGLTINLTKKAKPIADLPDQVPVPANLLGSTTSEKKSGTASVFLLKLTEAALPLDSFTLSDPKAVTSYVANFIHEEVNNLSKKIQLLFSIGMLGFNMLVWLRYFRTFSLLPLPTRVKIFNSWAYGKLALTRQLFKLVRSTALLAFFEHPAVIDVLENKKV